MNSSSNIQISQSSLLSLKAEVLRKQQEVNKAKELNKQQQQIQTPLREKNKKNVEPENHEPKNKGIEERQVRDIVEDEDLLRKSRRMLESKARLYNRLVKGPGSLSQDEIEMNKHYLVQFDRKDKKEVNESSEEEYHSDDYESASNPGDEWVEYTDCLGRTRKCLRKDLEYLKEKDSELSKTLDPERKKIENDAPKWVEDRQGNKPIETNEHQSNTITENNELLSNDMRKELLRQEWEKQENELLNKKNIHYQDILFNEARSHGVGYYAFSRDAEERIKQQEELQKLREETKQKQSTTIEQRELREKQLAARLKAARNRKRLRMGLPPEEDEPEQSTVTEEVKENEEEKLQAAKKEAEEKEKEKVRRSQIRPWDIGKEGVRKKHYEYSQEEWIDKKRIERPTEFAPPSNYSNKNKKRAETEDYCEVDKSLYFSTKKSKSTYHNTNLRQNVFEPTPMVNECEESEEESFEVQQKSNYKRKGAEIAPPPTFNYYGPSTTKVNKNFDPNPNLEDSISAGLRFLREQAEKKDKNAEKRNIDNT